MKLLLLLLVCSFHCRSMHARTTQGREEFNDFFDEVFDAAEAGPPAPPPTGAPAPSPSTVWLERALVSEEGEDIDYDHPMTLGECQTWCADTEGCHSLSYDRVHSWCNLKKKCVTAEEPSKGNLGDPHHTYYRPCTTAPPPPGPGLP